MKKNMKCTENIFRNRSIIRKNILIHAGLNTIFQFNINILINLLKFHLITWFSPYSDKPLIRNRFKVSHAVRFK